MIRFDDVSNRCATVRDAPAGVTRAGHSRIPEFGTGAAAEFARPGWLQWPPRPSPAPYRGLPSGMAALNLIGVQPATGAGVVGPAGALGWL